VSSEWQIVFLEGSVPALPKNFGASGVAWKVGILSDRKFGVLRNAPSSFLSLLQQASFL